MIQRTAKSLLGFLHSSPAEAFIPKVGASYIATRASSSLLQSIEPAPYSNDESAEFDWDNLRFGLTPTDYMFVTKCSGTDEIFRRGHLCPYGNIELSPSAAVLNYGQGIFEGTKAFRKDDGSISLFRPELNALRMQNGAERMCMPSPTIQQFVDAVKQTARANRRWIPPPGKGSLYIRPLLMGSGPVLGLAPPSEFTFMVYASPVGNYFKEGMAPLNIYVEEEIHRATPGGVGGVKSITNYAPVLEAIRKARGRGFSDVLYLNSGSKNCVEELSSCNIFFLKGNVLSTPAASGTILEGVTRKSIMQIADDHGYKVEERRILLEELMDADEVFCTGTAVGVNPVGSITYKGQRVDYKMSGDHQLVSRKLYSILVGIQRGVLKDKRGWLVPVE